MVEFIVIGVVAGVVAGFVSLQRQNELADADFQPGPTEERVHGCIAVLMLLCLAGLVLTVMLLGFEVSL